MRGLAPAVAFLAAFGCADEPMSRAPVRPEAPFTVEREPSAPMGPYEPRVPAPAKSNPAEIQLKVERLRFVEPKRQPHGLTVLVTQPEAGKPPDPSACLHLFWTHDASPTQHLGQTDAVYDPKTRRVRVTLRTWESRPGPGIGMDRGLERMDPRARYEFRVSLKDLAPGEHAYEVFEESRRESGAATTRLLSSGSIKLRAKP